MIAKKYQVFSISIGKRKNIQSNEKKLKERVIKKAKLNKGGDKKARFLLKQLF